VVAIPDLAGELPNNSKFAPFIPTQIDSFEEE
jgi:hypothetical protein